uniref:DUF4200 domain-containing protein n=1 Tax=Rhabditophanes sp. KR3021 TaxID=114890 RepID=A0AC35TNF8_9BILA
MFPHIPDTRKPLNVMSDPRVFRGSVAAKQREIQKIQREENLKRLKEEKYRTNVLRNRLEQSFSNVHEFSNISNNNIDAKHTGTISNDFHLPRLNGPLKTTRRFMEVEDRINSPVDIYRKRKSVPSRQKLLPLRKEESPRYSSIVDHQRSSSAGRIKKATGSFRQNENAEYGEDKIFKNVRFQPIESRNYDRSIKSVQDQYGPSKVVPTLKHESPRNRHTRHFRSKQGNLKDNMVPPNSLENGIELVDSSAQTSEDDERYLALLSEELGEAAISGAINGLESEKEIEKMKDEHFKVIRFLKEEQSKAVLLEKQIEKRNRIEEILKKERSEMEVTIKLLESRKLAYFTVNDLINGSINKLLDEELIKVYPKSKHIASDTKDLEAKTRRYELNVNEIEKDFLPWVIIKAEKIVEHHKAEKQLRHALFSKDSRIRTQARIHLRKYIRDAEKKHFKPYKFK